ncbi:hypothetical protein [Streptomyces sp. NPDC046939]|uniref:hypothetical protein n=1 Tax=Streptomyces sp. NPDC046939 TaxID=3155376 RepID=UPI0033D90269
MLAVATAWGVLVWAVARWVFHVDDPSGTGFVAGGVLIGPPLGRRIRERRRGAARR